MEVPKKLQNQLAQYQQLEQQAMTIYSQKQNLEVRAKEIGQAIEEIGALKDGKVYRNIGNLMVSVDDKEKLLKDLKDEKDITDIRIKTLDKQVERLRERLTTLQRDISGAAQMSG